MSLTRSSRSDDPLCSPVRSHTAHSLRGLATMLESERDRTGEHSGSSDLLERVRLIVGWR